MPREKPIRLGSGKLFLVEYTGSIPSDATIETEANRLGDIKGGASIEYKVDKVYEKDDLGLVEKDAVTNEEAILKSGIITLNGATLAKICATARVTEANGKRTVKIGGLGMVDGKKYLARFLHEDAVDGDVRVTVLGTNQNGFVLAYAVDKGTVTDLEFRGTPMDSDGTLLQYDEEIVALGALEVTSVAGNSSGCTAISVSPSLTPGNTYKYKTAASVTAPVFDAVLTTGWTDWTYTTEITATTGHKIQIAEVDGDNKCKKTGQATVTSKA